MDLPIKREWLEVNKDEEVTVDSNDAVRIVQWNILADALSVSSPTSNFCAVEQKYLDWSHRSQEILSQLKIKKADIICLQEVDHYEDCFVESLTGYESIYQPKQNSPCLKIPNNNGPDGVALFYKSSRFTLKESVCEYLEEENRKKGQQGFIVTVLEDEKTGKILICAVVHLKAKIGFEFRRIAQSRGALNILLQVVSKYPNTPLIWCGDFNGEYEEPFYELLMDSPLCMTSAYLKVLEKEPEYTTWKIRPQYEEKRAIDYIWISQHLLSVKGLLLPMLDEDVPAERFPCEKMPSDHIPLCIDVEYM